MAKKQIHIEPGDRFLRQGSVPTVWVVRRLLDLPDLPPHLHIVPENGHRVLTFAVSALADERLFRRLPGKAGPPMAVAPAHWEPEAEPAPDLLPLDAPVPAAAAQFDWHRERLAAE